MLAKVMLEVRDNLLISAQTRQTLRRNQRFLAQYGKEPVQRGSIAQKGMAIPHAKRHIAIYGRLVDISHDHASAGEPPTKIVDHPNVAPGTLLTMPFGQEPGGKQIQVRPERALTLTTQPLGLFDERSRSHDFSSARNVLEKPSNYAESHVGKPWRNAS